MPVAVGAVVVWAPWGTPGPGKIVPTFFPRFLPEIHAPKVGPKIDSLLILPKPLHTAAQATPCSPPLAPFTLGNHSRFWGRVFNLTSPPRVSRLAALPLGGKIEDSTFRLWRRPGARSQWALSPPPNRAAVRRVSTLSGNTSVCFACVASNSAAPSSASASPPRVRQLLHARSVSGCSAPRVLASHARVSRSSGSASSWRLSSESV